MSPEDAEKWAQALESGKYDQCSGLLHDSDYDSYCCLGVAAVVFGYKNADGLLYPREQDRALMSSEDEGDFIRANDEDSASFVEIAQLVREKYCA